MIIKSDKMVNHKKCVICDCNEDVRKFKLPDAKSDTARFLLWLKLIGSEEILKKPLKTLCEYVVCVNHFENKFVGPKKLVHHAIPSMNLKERKLIIIVILFI